MNVRTLATIGLISMSAAPAAAQTETFNFDYYCVTGAYQVCASVRLSSIDNHLSMQVWNLEGIVGESHTMTAIGLYHSGSTFDWAGSVSSWDVLYNDNSIKSYWKQSWSEPIRYLGGVTLELREGTNQENGISGCTELPGGLRWPTCFNGINSFSGQPYVEFTFDLSQHFSLNHVELRWLSTQTGVNNDGILKCDTGGAGDHRYPACLPNTTVPEPATVILTGTGILSAIAARRRRRSATTA